MLRLLSASAGKCDYIYYHSLKSKGSGVEEWERHRKWARILYTGKLYTLFTKAQIRQFLVLWKIFEKYD